MRVLAAAVVIGALLAPVAPPAFADESEAMKQQSETQKRRAEDDDRAYKATLKNIARPDKPVQVDPWSNARDSAPKSATK